MNERPRRARCHGEIEDAGNKQWCQVSGVQSAELHRKKFYLHFLQTRVRNVSTFFRVLDAGLDKIVLGDICLPEKVETC